MTNNDPLNILIMGGQGRRGSPFSLVVIILMQNFDNIRINKNIDDIFRVVNLQTA